VTLPPPARRYANLWALLPLVFVAAGAALRLTFPNDIEFKADERGFFLSAQAIAAGHAWPWIGPYTSIGSPAAPMSNWILGVMARASGAATPPDLARCVQISNLVALAVFTFGAWRMAAPRRATWLWAAALWAVNPIAVILERKIWNPSLLPLPAVLCYFAWLGRRSPWAAFVWGLLGAVIAQIHTGGAFFALSLAIWAFLRERRAFPWLPWAAGSLIGAAPAIPWLAHLAQFHGLAGHKGLRPPNPGFYLRFFIQPFGFGAEYTLGKKAFVDFLGWPRLGATATWLVGVLHLALVVVTLNVFYRGARAFWASGGVTWRTIFLGRDPDDTLICAALWGYGGCLTLITLGAADSHRHYLELVAPLMAVWCARTVQIGAPPRGLAAARVVLPALCAIQLAISGALLAYIDQRQVIPGDYGTIWRAQVTAPAIKWSQWPGLTANGPGADGSHPPGR
jgi:hypothetical protein